MAVPATGRNKMNLMLGPSVLPEVSSSENEHSRVLTLKLHMYREGDLLMQLQGHICIFRVYRHPIVSHPSPNINFVNGPSRSPSNWSTTNILSMELSA